MGNKTHKIVLFCKSYEKDMLRARRLAESVNRFNVDHIPFYVSVPEADLNRFRECFGDIPCRWMTDEEILDKSNGIYGKPPKRFPAELIQQLVKLEFWRMGLCQNYLWIDSDSYFIKPFRTDDFFYDEVTPYTLQHDTKDLFDFAKRIKKEKIIRDFEKMAIHFREWFHRRGPLYNFGGSPLIWSCKVLESLYEDYLKPKSITIYDLLKEYNSEMQLYGEYLMFSKVIPIRPSKPFFKIYHYAEQFFEAQMQGEWDFSLTPNYLGVVIQSNWARLPEPKKPTHIRLKRFFSKMLSQINQLFKRLQKSLGIRKGIYD